MSQSKPDLIIHSITCTNDTHGLFDFESKRLVKQMFKLRAKEDGKLKPNLGFKWGIYNLNNKIHLLEDSISNNFLSNNPSAYKILQISYDSSEYKIHSPENVNYESESQPTQESNVVWLVQSDAIMKKFNFKNRKSLNFHKLSENDILKFGRVELSVKCIITNTDTTASDLNLKGLNFVSPDTTLLSNFDRFNDNKETNHTIDTERISDSEVSGCEPTFNRPSFNTISEGCMDSDSDNFDEKTEKIDKTTDKISNIEELETSKSQISAPPLCRICLCGESDPGPLVSPCNCKGSLNYIHLECLRTWIKGRLSIAKDDDISFFWKELSCELCGMAYPSVVQIDDKETNLLNIQRPEPPYVVLEMASSSDKGCFVVSVAKNKATIGRGHESNVRLTDISVSRIHASIELDNGNIVIQDQQSKFGTLMKAKAPFSILIKEPICLQIGRSILLMTTKDAWSLKWPSCIRSDILQERTDVDISET